jgi:hypothetical protein
VLELRIEINIIHTVTNEIKPLEANITKNERKEDMNPGVTSELSRILPGRFTTMMVLIIFVIV